VTGPIMSLSSLELTGSSTLLILLYGLICQGATTFSVMTLSIKVKRTTLSHSAECRVAVARPACQTNVISGPSKSISAIFCFRIDANYFEIEIVDKGSRSPGISIGLAGRRHPLEARLGQWVGGFQSPVNVKC
jgi:hypothetical protein